MNSLSQYCIEVMLGSTILLLGFYLTRNYLSISFRRLYLLGCIFFSLLLPLIVFNSPEKLVTELPVQVDKIFVENIVSPSSESASESYLVQEIAQNNELESTPSIDWVNLAIYLYLTILALLLIRFCVSLHSLWRLTRNTRQLKNGISFHVIDNHKFSGGSFFHHIFISKKYLDDPSLDIILAHEQCHCRHWHSLDILLSEIYCVIFWANPASWLIRKELKLNAEYEADQFTAAGYGRHLYSDTLLKLSTNTLQLGGVVSFSAMNIRRRINHVLGGKMHHWSKSLLVLPFLVIATWLISCEPEMMDFTAMDPQAALKNVKTVTTRYISHQKDTQQKDGKIIAIAYYLPDGTVDKVEQHTTYPYDFEKPFEWKFLSSPNPVGVLHGLDGFSLGEAANNILYGNDWPKYKGADDIIGEGKNFTKKVTKEQNDFSLPTRYLIEEELNEDIYYQGEKRLSKGMIHTKHEETFDYDDQKITSHSRKAYYLGREAFLKDSKLNDNNSNGPPTRQLHQEARFFYNGDLLIKVTDNRPQNGSVATTHLNYENGIMTSASYFKQEKRYNHREFYYDESGLKTRTEIFNVYGEPEYTITYDYEYY